MQSRTRHRLKRFKLEEYSKFLEVDETLVEWDKQLLDADEFIFNNLD